MKHTTSNPLRIVLLHGYALHGSGSNVYINNLSCHLAAQGHEVHVVCQDRSWPLPNHIFSITSYDKEGKAIGTRLTEHAGASVRLHKPDLGPVLPVYNWDRYPGFDNVVTLPQLDDAAVEAYVLRHAKALQTVVQLHQIDVVHANHVVAMPEVARRVEEQLGTPFVIMPHGSAIEYVVRKDSRFLRLAERSLLRCAGLIVGGEEMLDRMDAVWGTGRGFREKAYLVPTGVDLELFQPRTNAVSEGPVISQEEFGKPIGNCQALQDQLYERAKRVTSDRGLLDEVEGHRAHYTPRAPDKDLEERLEALNYGSSKVIFFGGKLVAGKGVHTLIAAMACLVGRYEDARLVLVGEGSFREAIELLVLALDRADHELFCRVVRIGWQFDGKPPEALHSLESFTEPQKFSQLAKSAFQGQLRRKVVFAGYLTHRTLATLLAHSDVSVLPSAIPEAYPLSLVESLAAGIYPVVTDHGGARFFADNLAEQTQVNREMFAVSAGADEVVEALAATLEERLRGSTGPVVLARQIAEKSFGWATIASSLVTLYERVSRKAG